VEATKLSELSMERVARHACASWKRASGRKGEPSNPNVTSCRLRELLTFEPSGARTRGRLHGSKGKTRLPGDYQLATTLK